MTSLNTHYLTYDRGPDSPRRRRAQRRHWLWLLVLLLILAVGALYYPSSEHITTATASAACDAPIHDRPDTAIVENCAPLAQTQIARYGDDQLAVTRQRSGRRSARPGLLGPDCPPAPLISNAGPNHDPAGNTPDCNTITTGNQ